MLYPPDPLTGFKIYWVFGLFLEISCLEENEYPNTLDLRILVYLEQDVYFSCDDYFLINDFDKVYYFENKFYCFVDKEVDISLLDFGQHF